MEIFATVDLLLMYCCYCFFSTVV